MSDSSIKIRCKIVTPEGEVADVKVLDMVMPLQDGLCGILPGHAPMLCMLGQGLLRFHDSEKVNYVYYIEGGFGHVRDNEVTILTRQALRSDSISEISAKEQLIDALLLPMTTIEEVSARAAAICRAKHLITLAKSS